MSIWLDILNLVAEGKTRVAEQLLDTEFPMALRQYETDSKSRIYVGPVPSAVKRYIHHLPTNEKGLARFHEQDLVDHILDDVVNTVRRTMVLVQFAMSNPEASIDDLVDSFPWDPKLKRDSAWKKKRIVNYLRSIDDAGIAVPFKKDLIDVNSESYSFDELAFACSNERIEKSWKTFKRQQDLDGYYFAIDDSDSSFGVDAEAVDYGTINIAKVVLGAETGLSSEVVMNLHILGANLTIELTSLMEAMHASKPKEGYRPIAWHNVFWCLLSDYEGLHMTLKVLNPYCERDYELAEYLTDHYRDITSTSRPVIYRRRRGLHDACIDKVLTRVREEYAA